MIRLRGWLRRGLSLALLVALYFIAGRLGLLLAFVNASATAVWPPTGLAIAALLLFGTTLWPGILLGAFAVNLTTSGDVLSSVGIAVGNTLEAVVATYLIRRWASGRAVFDRPQDVLRFALFAAALAPTVSATVGVASLELTGLAGWSDVGPIWLTWWLGDAAGALLVAPAVVLWATNRFVFAPERLAEAAVLAIAALTTGVVIFGGVGPLSVYRVPVAFLTFPVLVWAAFRFGPRAAATVMLALSGIAIWGTLNGFGPYALGSPNESLLLLQAFMAVAAVTSLVLGAAVLDRTRTEKRLLAVEQHSRLAAEEGERLREEFLSVATHELRTPVAAVSGYAQLAQRALAANRSDRLGDAVDSIVRQSRRLAALITQLLDASYVQRGQFEIEPRPTDISAVAGWALEAARLADDGRHQWDLRIEPGMSAHVDPMRWEQLLMNLLDNAMKYSPERRTIAVSLERLPTGPFSLRVADQGIGIGPDRIGHVFDRFYRAHDHQRLSGLGLGLYIAREIAERHGGGIQVSSVVGEGTEFAVTLPATPPVSMEPPGHADDPDWTRGSRTRGRVLVIDDEPDVRMLVETVLRDAGQIAMSAENGEEALALVTREPPDLILLDKLMPVMDGTAFAKAYRATVAHPAPIVAFCASRDAEAWASAIGAVAYVGKPFDITELDRTVRRQLSAVPR
ncbi:MAG: response regulator [Chloroflexi bacterium]|nr:MAG: response regulator [Chloroflexota bacterium]